MSHLEPRHVRLYGPPFALWDVRDVEAHVRTLLDAKLRERNARLAAAKYDDALTYLVALCWRLSGVDARGWPRLEHYAEIYIATAKGSKRQTLGPFPDRDRAETAVSEWRTTRLPAGATSFVGYREQRPVGAFDPTVGIAFSTYSRRILAHRVIDWFRSALGDSRYGANEKPLSLDQLAEEWERNDGSGAADSYLDHNGPGASLDFVDELNRHAYYDPFEERDTRAVSEQGGDARAAAVG